MIARQPADVHKVDSVATFLRSQSADVTEGVSSFLEKRPPRFPETVPSDLPAMDAWWARMMPDPGPFSVDRTT